MKKGFTLAEVLITVGIIGVTSMLVMPMITGKFTQQGRDKQLKKFIVDFEHGLMSEFNKSKFKYSKLGKGGNANVGLFLRENFGVGKDCGVEAGNCFAQSYINNDGQSKDFDPRNGYSVQLKNGVSIYLKPETQSRPAKAYIDVNGPSGPNSCNKDIFTVTIGEDYSVSSPACSLDDCAFKVAGVCYGDSFNPTPLTYQQCMAEKDKLGIEECYENIELDYWAGAVKQCGGIDKMPNSDNLHDIGATIYGNDSWNQNFNADSNVAKILNIKGFCTKNGQVINWGAENCKAGENGVVLWRRESMGTSSSVMIFTEFSWVGNFGYYRGNSQFQAICILD